jgi:hypothetical protein
MSLKRRGVGQPDSGDPHYKVLLITIQGGPWKWARLRHQNHSFQEQPPDWAGWPASMGSGHTGCWLFPLRVATCAFRWPVDVLSLRPG